MNSGATLSGKVQYVIEKITTKLHKPIENLARAKLIVRYIRELKALVSENEQNLEEINALLRAHNIAGYLMVSYAKILKYGLLVDETLRCLLPIIRQKSDTTKLLVSQLVEHGAAIFGTASNMFISCLSLCTVQNIPSYPRFTSTHSS